MFSTQNGLHGLAKPTTPKASESDDARLKRNASKIESRSNVCASDDWRRASSLMSHIWTLKVKAKDSKVASIRNC